MRVFADLLREIRGKLRGFHALYRNQGQLDDTSIKYQYSTMIFFNE